MGVWVNQTADEWVADRKAKENAVVEKKKAEVEVAKSVEANKAAQKNASVVDRSVVKRRARARTLLSTNLLGIGPQSGL